MNTIQQQKTDYLFSVLDKSGEGKVTQSDLLSLLQGFATDEGKAQKAAKYWWLTLKLYSDTDKDKDIEKNEWQVWAEGISNDTTEETSHSLDRWGGAIFASLRGDDQTITLQEYSQWFNAFGLEGDAETSFNSLDVNGNGEISDKEFKQRLNEYFKADDTEAAGNYLWGNPFV